MLGGDTMIIPLRKTGWGMVLIVAVLGSGLAQTTAADTYEYTGGPYSSCYGSYAPCYGNYGVTGSFTSATLSPDLTDQVIDPTSFTLTDGLITLTQSNTVTSYFEVSTDASGNIIDWSVNATLYSIYYTSSYELGSYETIYSSPATDWSIYNSYFTFSVPISFPNGTYCDATQSFSYECGANTYQGYLYSGASDGANPGNWIDVPGDPVSTPEPSSSLLLSSGLVGLALLRRNPKSVWKSQQQ
jgi:hypothetical protein